MPPTFVGSRFGSPVASVDYINIITLARGEIMLRMVKLRGAQLILHLCTARCNLHSEPKGARFIYSRREFFIASR